MNPSVWLLVLNNSCKNGQNVIIYAFSRNQMAESMSTPTKICPRNPVCSLCGDSYESNYVLRIFSKAGSSKDLCAKVHKNSGIKISKDPIKAQNML